MVDNNNSADGSAAGEDNVETAGSVLRAARERAGLDCAEVARQLNLLPKQVIALEEGRYDVFPGELFAKGHLRSYARLMKLDADTLVGSRNVTPMRFVPHPVQQRKPLRPVTLETVTRQRRHWGLGAALLVVLSLWGWQHGRERSELLPLTAETGDTATVPLGGIDAALSAGRSEALLDSVQLLPNPTAAVTKPEQNSGAAPAPAAVPAADVDKLSLRFSADCWVEIKDRDNKLLVAVLKHADDELKIEGRGPFKVLLGYAPGVEMAYNGTPVKVDVSERSRSARLIVGNS